MTEKKEEPRSRETAGGFGRQPLWLRILLVVSLAALATGVVRCSFEMTAEPPAAHVGKT